MKKDEEGKQDEFPSSEKSKKSRLWVTHAIYWPIIIGLIFLLCKQCSDSKKEFQRLEREYQASMDSLSQEMARSRLAIRNLEKSNDSLGLRILELKNRKAVLIIKEGIINGKSGRRISAVIVPSTDKRASSRFIEDVIKPVPFEVVVPAKCPEIKYSCIVDTFNVKINESTRDYSKDLFNFTGYRLFPSSDFLYMDKPEKKSSCFDLEASNSVPYSYTFNQYAVDNTLVKRANTKYWIATGGRLISMLGYAWLHHSDKQFAITYNGIPPYDPANPYKDANDSDKKIAGNKAWAERGIWLLYGGSEVLGYSGYRDLVNAYSVREVTLTFNLDFNKK